MLDLILNGLLPPPSLDYEAQPTSESHSESSSDTAKSAGGSTIRIRERWAVGEALEQATPAEICHHLLSIRYLETRRNPVEKSEAFYRDILPSLQLDRYHHFLRTSPQSLYFIAERIAGHRIFMLRGTKPQAPVQKQLAVALRRLACEYSSSGSIISTS